MATMGMALLYVQAARAMEPELRYTLSDSLDFGSLEDMVSATDALRQHQTAPLDTSVKPAAYVTSGRSYRSGRTQIGYDDGFVIASPGRMQLDTASPLYVLRLNGWGQLRHATLNSQGPNPDVNQFQLKRARLVFSGHAYTTDFAYYVQLDGRSSSGDDVRLLDYLLTYDLGHHLWDWQKGALVFKTGKYKMPFTMARYLSGREFEFADRALASTFFDVNRSLAWGLSGARSDVAVPWNWEIAIFNGLVTGGAETGSSGALDDNFAYSGRVFAYPIGEWGLGQLADLEWHDDLAVRSGMAFAHSTIDASGATEFSSLRVVDAGVTLASLLPMSVGRYTVNLYSVDSSFKWRGWSGTLEYYLRSVDEFDSPGLDSLFDHGLWFQLGKFVLAEKLQLLARWSRVTGDSGTLGVQAQSSEEIAAGAVWYFRGQNAKLTVDATYLDGAPISSSALDISPGDAGWLFRSQVQFAF